MPTGVNYMRLVRWEEKAPVRVAKFMDNFFRSCHEYEPRDNFGNYVRVINLYSATAKVYQVNRRRLIRAFYEITGTPEGAFD